MISDFYYHMILNYNFPRMIFVNYRHRLLPNCMKTFFMVFNTVCIVKHFRMA